MSVDPGSVLLAYLHPNTVSHSFSQSISMVFSFDLAHEARLARGGGPAMFRCGVGSLVEARNDCIRHFLDDTQAEWLWVVDTDMGFPADTLERLVAAADPVERPVVGALCFSMRENKSDGSCGWDTSPAPTLFGWAKRADDDEFGFVVRWDYSVGALTKVAGTGSACILIHRSAVEKVRLAHGDTWYDRVVYAQGKKKVSEDLSFCYRLGTVGVPVYVDCSVRATHHKEVWLGEWDYWSGRTIPYAVDEVAVIVPVMRRPQNAEPFMRSLRASTGLAQVYAVADEDDKETIDAWRAAGADDVIVVENDPPRPGTFAEKLNRAYSLLYPGGTDPDAEDENLDHSVWVFIVGDDVRFHPGWLDHAQYVARTMGASVVGTNDLGTQQVQAGEHATHLLISRDYIEQHGASWDGPGVIAHEGYHHWFVDNEIVTAAKARQTWAMALGSVVEHMHPLFGRGEDDEVYALGVENAEKDRERFVRRCQEHL
jgi:GT2 family glycosyltransferase